MLQSDLSYIEKEFTMADSINLSYIDLMTDLRNMPDGKYYNTYLPIPKKKDEDEEDYEEEESETIVVSPDQRLVNKKIEKVTSFNITIYSVIKRRNEESHKTIKYDIDKHNYEHLKVNNYYLKVPNLLEGETPVNKEDTLEVLESVFFNNTTGITINIDNKFLQYDDKGKLILGDDGKPEYGKIRKGDYFYLYFVVGTIDTPEEVTEPAFKSKLSGANAELYYKFIYNPAEKPVEKDEDNNEDSSNEWVIIPEKEFELEENVIYPIQYSSYYISDVRWEKYVFLNTVSLDKLNDLPKNTLSSYDPIVRIYISPLCPVEFTVKIRVKANSKTKVYTFNYVPKSLNVSNPSAKRAIKMNNPDVSYALLRTNPKLTGNIKVVIDENSNIYIDTFKVSDTLSQKKYRHIKVGEDSYYGSTLLKFFKDMPTTELYKVENKCYNLFSTVNSLQDQIYDTYRYGVKTNDDKLYSENYALLAPLCVKRILPDFFLIFRVDKNSILYNETTMSNSEKIQYFLSNGVLVKAFDMRLNSSLGKYIRNIYKYSKEEPGDIYVSYSTENLNKFIGISLDKGVVSSIYESSYSDVNIKNQVALNDFYTNGFERNHIVSKNIINFEFMFNDNDVEPFSLNTYFGLYVKVNEQEESFSCIGYNDEKHEYIFDSSIYTFPKKVNLKNTNISSIIYGLTTPDTFIRLNKGIKNNDIISNYKLKPYKNLLTSKVNKIDLRKIKSFITINIHKPLEVGDHYRIIDTYNNVIYEVIISDLDNAIALQEIDYNTLDNHNSYNLSDVITNYYNDYGVNFIIKRIALYTHYRRSDYYNISEQVEQLYYAFRKVGDENITSYKYNNNSISFVSNFNGTLFEKICAASGFDKTLKQYVYETEDENDSITYFGYLQGKKIILDLTYSNPVLKDIPNWKTKTYAYLYPIDFEIAGNRMANVYGFINISNIGDGENIYECEINNASLYIFNNKTILYYVENKKSAFANYTYTDFERITQEEIDEAISIGIYQKFNIDTFVNNKELSSIYISKQPVSYIQSFNDLSKYVINVSNPLLKNSYMSLYSSYPLNSGVCSIFNIKDFDFDVLDNKTIINSAESDEVIGTAGEYAEDSIFSTREFLIKTSSEEDKQNESLDEILDNNNGKIIDYYNGEDGEKNEFGDPYCYFETNIGNNKIVEKDQVLYYQEANYVVKHFTYEEYIQALIYRLRYLEQSKKFISDAAGTLPGAYITEGDVEKLKMLLGMIPTEKYAGIILRPFVTQDNIAYDESYTYFNYLVKYKDEIIESDDSIRSYFGIYDTYNDEKYGFLYKWSGLNAFLNKISLKDFDLENEDNRLINPADIDNIVYEEEKDLEKICPNEPLLVQDFTEESFINYIDKFEKYSDDKLLLSGNNRNINRTNYLKTIYRDNHTKFDISLTCPYVCKWKSIGTDARIGNLRLMYDFSSFSSKNSYYIVSDDSFYGYLGVLYLKNKNSVIKEKFGKKYINRSVDDVLYIDNKTIGQYEKNFILDGNGRIDDILYDTANDQNKFSVAYTIGNNILEFISGGIKFRIKSNNKDIIDFSKYNGYSAVFISLPIKNITSDNVVELIIDETCNEIVFIWYCYTNTLEYGIKVRGTDGFDNISISEKGLIANKINYTKKISDISYKPIITDYGTYKASIIEDTMNFENITNKNTKDSEYLLSEDDDKFTRYAQKLCNSNAYIFISNMGLDPYAYTSNNIAIITGQLYNDRPIIKNIDVTYPYYNDYGYITPINPFIWHTYKDAQHHYHEEMTDSGIALYTNNLGKIKDSILYTDDITCIPSSIRTISELKTSLNNCSIYIKTLNGKYDYSTVKNLLNISIVDPITYNRFTTYKRNVIDENKIIKDTDKDGHIVMHVDNGNNQLSILYDKSLYSNALVHSTYAEPVMKDILSFYYNSNKHKDSYNIDLSSETYTKDVDDLEDIFNMSFDGANVYIKDTNNLDQVWINKYTTDNNYCLIGTRSDIKSMVFPIDVLKNVSIMDDCAFNTTFKKYSIYDESQFSLDNSENYVYERAFTVRGYENGVEVKSFINSKALSLNTYSIEIEKWKDTEILLLDNCIKLNITSSLIDFILEQESFNNWWKENTIETTSYKIQYIKNCVLKYININNKIKFELRRSKNKIKKLKCSNIYQENFIEYKNFKNELKFENNNYYMYIYVDEFYTYYPKITIFL